MKKRHFLSSLNNAVDGFFFVVRHERNMRVHFVMGFLVLAAGVILGISRVEWIILCTVIALVWAAEMLNTAIEHTVDLVERSIHHNVRVIKDISAGAVLITAVNALIVGFFIFSPYWSWPLELAVFKVRQAPHITFIAFLTVVFLVIAGKSFLHSGTPFQGGVISGHAAVAFCLWTSILFTQDSPWVWLGTFFLAVLVARSRIRAKIHSLKEVLTGSVIGFLVTAIFFQIFS